jgi:YggT family protein
MIALASFLHALAVVLNAVLSFAMILVIIRAILSWFSPDPYNPLVRALHSATDPLLRHASRWIPTVGGIDWSPLILLFIILFLQNFLVSFLSQSAMAISPKCFCQ